MSNGTIFRAGDRHVVRAKPGNQWVGFEIFEVVTTPPDAPEFWPAGQDTPFPSTPDIDAAESIAEGDVKWDGCANWTAGRVCAVHACGLDGYQEQLAVLRCAYRIAAWLLGDAWQGGDRGTDPRTHVDPITGPWPEPDAGRERAL